MGLELSRDGQKAAAKLYKAYLDKVHIGSGKASAREFSDEEITVIFVDETPEDVIQTFESLKKALFIEENIIGDVTLTDAFIVHMENRFKNGLKDVLSFLAQFIP